MAPADHMAQARFCYDRLKDVMRAAGGSLDDIVDMICFNHDARGMDAAVDTWCNETVDGLPIGEATSYTAIGMTGLHRMGQVGCYRAIADFSAGPRVAHNLPSVHWHEQRISGASRKKSGRLIGISGQVASDGQQNIIARGDVASQAHYCFSQIRGVLEKHGAGLDDIVEIVSFHKDPRAWETVMGVGHELFQSGPRPGLDAHRLHRPLPRRLPARNLRDRHDLSAAPRESAAHVAEGEKSGQERIRLNAPADAVPIYKRLFRPLHEIENFTTAEPTGRVVIRFVASPLKLDECDGELSGLPQQVSMQTHDC